MRAQSVSNTALRVEEGGEGGWELTGGNSNTDAGSCGECAVFATSTGGERGWLVGLIKRDQYEEGRVHNLRLLCRLVD